MRLLTTLYVTDHRARVSVHAHSIVVRTEDGRRLRVPVETLEAVVIASHAQVSSEALALCAESRIRVTGLTRGGRVRFTSSPGMGGNVLLRLRQYRVAEDDSMALAIARMVAAGKLVNAGHCLSRWSYDAPISTRRSLKRLRLLVAEQAEKVWSAPSGDHVRGCEGSGTRAYFDGLRLHLLRARPGLAFEARTRRPPRDEVNATLSYCYGLILGEISGALEAVGLDPQVGFLHRMRPGRPSLALDLLEEFRPAVADRFAVGLLARRMLGGDAFVAKPAGACYLSDDGRRTLLSAWDAFRTEEVLHPLLGRRIPRAALAVTQATLMARHLRGDLPAYPPYVLAR